MTGLICSYPSSADGAVWEQLTSVSHRPVKMCSPGPSAQPGSCESRRMQRRAVVSPSLHRLRPPPRVRRRNPGCDSILPMLFGAFNHLSPRTGSCSPSAASCDRSVRRSSSRMTFCGELERQKTSVFLDFYCLPPARDDKGKGRAPTSVAHYNAPSIFDNGNEGACPFF
jgi:hypothetical protein